MFPIDIQQKIEAYLRDAEQEFALEYTYCFENKREGNIEWYNMPNVQRFICIDELFVLKAKLEELLSGDVDIFQDYLLTTCAEYAKDKHSPLYRFSHNSDNPAFELLLKVVIVFFKVDTVNDVLSLFIPLQLEYDFNDTLVPSKYTKHHLFGQPKYGEIDIQVEIKEQPLRESELTLRASCPDTDTLNDLQADCVRKLHRSEIHPQYIFELCLRVRQFSFSMHFNLYTTLKAHYPAVEEQLYLRNGEWEALREKILKVKYQQDYALRTKIQWLQEHLRAVSSRNTGNEFVGEQINPILMHFNDYLREFSPETLEKIYDTSIKSLSLRGIMDKLGDCTDTAADALDVLLAAKNYQALLSQAPDSQLSAFDLIRKYTKEHGRAMDVNAVARVDAPDHHIQKVFKGVRIFTPDNFIVLLGNFPPEKLDIILPIVNLYFIPYFPMVSQGLSEVIALFQDIFFGDLIDQRSRIMLASVMAKYPRQFGGIEFLAQLAIMINHVKLLEFLHPSISLLPLIEREAILEANIINFGMAFHLLLRHPRLLSSFLKNFTGAELAAWLQKCSPGVNSPRLFDLMNYPDALQIILGIMDMPLKTLLMVETKSRYLSFLITTIKDDHLSTMTIALSAFPAERRLGIINQSNILQSWAFDKPEYIRAIIALLPAQDLEHALTFEEQFMRSMIAELCSLARHAITVECMEIVLQALPRDRLYPFVTNIGRDGQTVLHQVTGNPFCIKMIFDMLTPEERERAFFCVNGAGSTLESFINNKKTMGYIKGLLPNKVQREVQQRADSRVDLPFWRAKRPRVTEESSVALDATGTDLRQ